MTLCQQGNGVHALTAKAPPPRAPKGGPQLHFDGRCGIWREDGVQICRLLWADLQVTDGTSAKVSREIKKKLSEALGKDAVVSGWDQSDGQPWAN